MGRRVSLNRLLIPILLLLIYNEAGRCSEPLPVDFEEEETEVTTQPPTLEPIQFERFNVSVMNSRKTMEMFDFDLDSNSTSDTEEVSNSSFTDIEIEITDLDFNSTELPDLNDTVTPDSHLFMDRADEIYARGLVRNSTDGNSTNIIDSFIDVEVDEMDRIEDIEKEASVGSCVPGFYSFNDTGTCYTVIPFEGSGDWFYAGMECAQMGGTLVVLDSVEEWLFITQLPRFQANLWLGAFDIGGEGSWKNVEGELYAGPWTTDPVNVNGAEDCQLTRNFENGVGILNQQCDKDAMGAVCETPAVGEKKVCPSSSYLYDGACYKLEVGSGTWADARTHCLEFQCEIASPNSIHLFNFFHLMGAGEGIWMGATDAAKPGYWVNPDNTPYEGPWAKMEPNSFFGIENCMQLGDYNDSIGVQDAKCDSTGTGVICKCSMQNTVSYTPEKPTTEPPPAVMTKAESEPNATAAPDIELEEDAIGTTTEYPEDPHCPSGWHYSNLTYSCYFMSKLNADFYTSVRMCNDMGGALVSVDDEVEMKVVLDLTRPNYWIGANERGHTGLHMNLDGTTYAGPPPKFSNVSSLNNCLYTAGTPDSFDKFVASADCHDMLSGFVCEKLSSMIDGDVDCGADWRLYESNCYYLNHNFFHWQEAKESCEFIQSELAFPVKQADVNFYYTIGAGHGYWLGAKDDVTEGYWLDINNLPYGGPWAYGFPKENTTENCMSLEIVNNRLDPVHRDCSKNGTGAICKKDKTPRKTFCHRGWYLYEGHCFKLIDRPGDKDELKRACTQVGGRLAVPYNLGVFEFFVALGAGAGTWLGPTDASFENIWITPEGERFIGIWHFDEPSESKDENCMMIQEYHGSLGVTDERCEIVGTGAICEVHPAENFVAPTDSAPKVVPDSLPDPYCPLGWTNFQGSCYRALHENHHFFTGALACKKEGGILAVISSAEEKNFIVDVLGTGTHYWLGSTDEGHEGTWISSDGSTFTGPWGPDQPDNGGVTSTDAENCVWTEEFEGLDSIYFADAFCFAIGNGSVCERNVLELFENDTVTVPPPSNISGNVPPSECPDGWVPNGEWCYLAIKEYTTFNMALENCTNAGGVLGYPRNEEELAYMLKLEGVSENFWIGVIRKLETGEFLTSTGLPYTGPLELLDDESSENVSIAESRNDTEDSFSRRRRSDMSDTVENNYQFDYEKERYDCMILFLDVDNLELRTKFGNCRSAGFGGVCRRRLFNQTTTCPIGWFYQDSICYWLETNENQPMSWNEANSRCESYGATLHKPVDQNDVDLLASFGARKGTWLGMNDIEKEGSFVDKYGAPYKGPFVEGQPRNLNNEDCGNMYILEHQIAVNDYTCAGLPDSTTALCSLTTREINAVLPEATCPNGWVQINADCYKNVEAPMTYEGAVDACTNLQSSLAVPRNQKEYQFLVNDQGQNNFWLGVSDQLEEFNWVQIDGLNFTGVWGKAEPSNGTLRNCMCIQEFSAKAVDCSYMGSGVICHKQAFVQSESCPEGWYYFHGHCYAIVPGKTSYEAAKAQCTRLGAGLASPNNLEENTFLVSIGVGNGYWLGTKLKDGVWVDANGSSVEEFDNVPVSVDTDGAECQLMALKSGVLVPDDVACTEIKSVKGAVCERAGDDSEDQIWCPEGWTFLFGDCYKAFYRPVTWYQARDGCATHRSRLAYPKDVEDVSFFLSIDATDGVWMGATDIGDEGYFLGSDGDAIPYSGPWNAGAPDNNGDNRGEDCVALMYDNQTDTFGMDDLNCAEKLNGFLCVRAGGTLYDFDSLCEKGWVFYKDSCYKPSTGSMTWDEAHDECERQNSQMGYPTDEEEMLFMYHEGAVAGFWIGVYDVSFRNVWVTVDRSSYDGPWGPGRPKLDNRQQPEGCGMIQDFGYGLINVDQRDCGESGSGVMCRKFTLSESDCPDGWTGFQEKCYYIAGGNWSWTEAKSMCEDLGAIMTAPNTNEELQYLLTLGVSSYFWLGSSDSDNEGTWVNLDGNNFEGSWGKGQPDNNKAEKVEADCMIMIETPNGEMEIQDESCATRGTGTVCERSMSNHPVCAPGWVLYSGKCYNRILSVVNYTDAEFLCHSYEAYLASLWDIGQMDFALTAAGCGFGTWLGASDKISENFWLTDRGFKYAGPWRNGQPDGSTDQNCMMIASFTESSLGVADKNCDFPGTGALCEYIPKGSRIHEKKVTAMPELETTTASPCEDGWTFFEEYCYKTIEGEDISWFEAISTCSDSQAYPATIQSSGEVDYFLGLNISGNPELWLGASAYFTNGTWTNIDGSPLDAAALSKDTLDSETDSEDSLALTFDLEMNRYKLVGYNYGDVLKGVVCKKSLSEAPCPEGSALFFGSCFSKNGAVGSWTNASEECSSIGARLAVATNKIIQEFLSHLIGSALWLGARYSEQYAKWINSDGTDTPAYLIQSLAQKQDEVCLKVSDKEDISPSSCANELPYLCEVVAGAGDDGRCSDGWQSYNGSCYRKFEQEITWYEANVYCFQYESFPAAIYSESDKQYILTLAEDGYWIGAKFFKESSQLRNLDNSVVNSNWYQAQDFQEHTCLMANGPEGAVQFSGGNCLEKLKGVVCQKKIVTRSILGCEIGYIRHFDSCYKKELGEYSHHEAKHVCRDQDSFLAVPDNLDDMNFLAALGMRTDYTWLGSSDQGHEGIWINSDKSEYFARTSSQGWIPGQPDNDQGAEDCMALMNQQMSYGPADVLCSTESTAFICEQRVSEKLKECPYGWTNWKDSCYYTLDDDLEVNFFGAAVRCFYYGAYPTTINSQEEMEAVTSLLKDVTWIGQTNLATSETRYVGLDLSELDLETGNLTLGNVPLDEDEPRKCLLMKNGMNNMLLSSDCSLPHKVQCELPKKGWKSPNCPKGYMYFYERCYKLFLQAADWLQAKENCRKEGGYLATPNYYYEQELLTAMGQNIEGIYLGYTDEGHSQVYTGTDGTDFTVLWAKNQPNNCCSGQDCLAIGDYSGQYSLGDTSCSNINSGYICEVLDSVAAEEMQCPKGWLPRGDSCYLIRSLEGATWRDSLFICSYYEGHLINLRDADTLDFLVDHGARDRFWLGAHDHGNETFFENPDGTPYNGPWGFQQPDDRMEVMFGSQWRRRRRGISDGVNYGSTYDISKAYEAALTQLAMQEFDEETNGGSSSSELGQNRKSKSSTSGSQCTMVLERDVYDCPCQIRAGGFVCERPRSSIMPCAHNQLLFEGHCYEIRDEGVSWFEAKKNCADRGGYLMVVNSFTELVFAKLVANFETYIWLGASDIEDPGSWMNVDGTPFDESFFLKGEPNNAGNTEHCTALTQVFSEDTSMVAYGIADIHCPLHANGSICEFSRQDEIF